MKYCRVIGMLLLVSAIRAQKDAQVDARDIWDTGFVQKRPASTAKAPERAAKSAPHYAKAAAPTTSATPERPGLAEPAEPAFGITLWRLRVPAPADRDAARLLVQDTSSAKEYVAQRIEPSASLQDGDRVRLGIEVPRTGFLYVVDREQYQDGSLGEPVLLFPTLNVNHGDNKVEPGRLIEIPDQNGAVKALKIIRSRPEHTGEDLMIIVSPKPLEGVNIAEGEQILPSTLVEGWIRQWSLVGTRWDLTNSSTKLWSNKEKEAASPQQTLLHQEDPLPASIVAVPRQEGASTSLVHFPIVIEAK